MGLGLDECESSAKTKIKELFAFLIYVGGSLEKRTSSSLKCFKKGRV